LVAKSHEVAGVDKLLSARSPALVAISSGGAFPPVDVLELCVARGVPFVTIGQSHDEGRWYDDELAARYRAAVGKAVRCYFVSRANKQLVEMHLACDLTNAEVVWNPFNVDYDAAPLWPSLSGTDQLQLACIARLDPRSKGQDLLLQALATPEWLARDWHLNLYGEGPMRDALTRLVRRFGLSGRVTFVGYRPVEDIWASNHALVLPSRYEGLPLAMVEAMLCARPVVATDVAGHAEIVEDGVTGFLAASPTVASVAGALERLWASRSKLEVMGSAGARRIRAIVPADPVQVFSKKLVALIQLKR
jgi:glycosyltransferase involved in cell wall biosynthesis